MYLRYFDYAKRPFECKPDAEFFFASRKHRVGLAVLEYSLENASPLCVLTGDVGSGKTTLIDLLLGRADKRYHFAVVRSIHSAFGSVLDAVCEAMGTPTDVPYPFRSLNVKLRQLKARGRSTILVIDEAQNLSVDDLEAVRVLTNLDYEGDPLLQLLLVGQPELRAKLAQPELAQLRQRVAADYNLTPLEAENVALYILHRERVAGVRNSRFTPEAISRIAEVTRGVPRVINALCDMALVYACTDDVPEVGVEIVEEVIREKSEGGLFWLPTSAPPARAPTHGIAPVQEWSVALKAKWQDLRSMALK